MMGAVDSGHIQTLWTLLHLARSRRAQVSEDNLVAMVSPWHHNAQREIEPRKLGLRKFSK